MFIYIKYNATAWNKPSGQVASLLLLDVSGAFDNVSHERLLRNLCRRRVDEKTVTWIASFLTNRRTNIMVDGHRSEEYKTTTGIAQGSPLSHILYLFYNADLIETCNGQPNTIGSGYIDDVTILRRGDTTEETCNALGRTLRLANQWASKHASIFAPDKFQLTHYTRQKYFNTTQPVIIDQATVMPKKASRYLGITMDGELNWKLHIQEIKIKATKSIGALASLAGST